MHPSAPPLPVLFRCGTRSVALLLALTLGTAAGCSKPEKKARERASESEPAAASESTQTRELEDKAAGYKERFQEIQDSDMTAEQKAQAAGALVDEQQRTVREAEDATSAPADSGASADNDAQQ